MKTIRQVVQSSTLIPSPRKTGKGMLMFASTLLIAFLGCIGVLWMSSFANTKQTDKVSEKTRFHVTLDGTHDLNPERILLLSMEVDGELRDIVGHEIEESEFKSLLHEGNPKKPCLLQLQVYDEEKTAVATLSHVLAKLRAASDPQRETIIFLYLNESSRP